ncbi:potassium channel family protein [Limibacillus halophilus]|uniref:Voltage-gated potassium channel n=1 Tax=Limibacillus halophilus TaxID=1579333 RepID=A0A839SVP0_9PROT|nr:potassium channel family protein [Limibacillus halophilus]MBB3066871.1 voltage-gated potassium channel [Limibacillus halophilus]
MRARLRELYYGTSETSQRFRFALIGFDILTIGFFIVTTVLPTEASLYGLDYLIAVLVALDLAARVATAHRPASALVQPGNIVDLVVVISLLAPLLFENLAFLRVLRMLRLLRSYHLLKELREHSRWFRLHEEVLRSSVNLFVFVFFVASVVYVLEGRRNPDVTNFLDALYFTVTTLTTTGYGDIIMTDTLGRLLTIVIMIFGVALFLRLAQTIFRPAKVQHVCSSCGLERHEPDAVHCKHCGETIHIRTEGA